MKEGGSWKLNMQCSGARCWLGAAVCGSGQCEMYVCVLAVACASLGGEREDAYVRHEILVWEDWCGKTGVGRLVWGAEQFQWAA